MKYWFVIILVVSQLISTAQNIDSFSPRANIRLSFLIIPFTPLLTAELRVIKNSSIQIETNFVNTHGVNIKYFISNTFEQGYIFTGLAIVENELLRADSKNTYLPYLGYGYAYRFGNRNTWVFDSRIGLGNTLNADTNFVLPVLKTGIGKLF